jgi:hypothetical protein
MWKSKTLHGRHAYYLETPDVSKLASNTWLKVGRPFPETSVFMIAIQGHALVPVIIRSIF